MPRSRGEVKVQLIKDPKQRGVAFRKRRFGVMKKAYELSVMTECEVLVVVMKEEKIYQFGSQPVDKCLVSYFKQRFADATSIEDNFSPSDIINEVHEAKKRKLSNSSNLSEDDHFAEATALFEKRCKLEERRGSTTRRNSNEVSSTSMPLAADKICPPFELQNLHDKKPSTKTKKPSATARLRNKSSPALPLNHTSASSKTRPLLQLTHDHFSVLEMRPTSLPGARAPRQNEFGLVMDPEDSDTSDASSLSEVTSAHKPPANFHQLSVGPKTGISSHTNTLTSSADSLLTPEPDTIDPVVNPFCTIENTLCDSTSLTDEALLSFVMRTVGRSLHSPLTVDSTMAPTDSTNQNESNASALDQSSESNFVTLTTPVASGLPTNHVIASVRSAPMESEQLCVATSSLHPSSPLALTTASSPKVNPRVHKLSPSLETPDGILSL